MDNPALKNGLLCGGLLAILSFLMGMLAPKAYISFGSSSFYIIVIVFMVMTGNMTKRNNGGTLSFGEAFISIFTMMSVAIGIWLVFQYLQYNFLQPNLVEVTKEVAVESMETLAELMGGNEEVSELMEEAAEEIENDANFNFSIGKIIASYFMSLVIGAVFTLIIAAIIKKD